MNIRPEVKSEPVIARFRALRDAGADLSVPLSSCGEIVLTSIIIALFSRKGLF